MVREKLYRNTAKYANKLITFSFDYNDFACQYFGTIDCSCVFEDEIEMAEGESRSVYFFWRNNSFVPLLSDSFCLIGISLPFHATSVLLLNSFTRKESHNRTSSVSGCRFLSNNVGCCVVYSKPIKPLTALSFLLLISELVSSAIRPLWYHVTVFWSHHWTLQITRVLYSVIPCCSAAEQPGLVWSGFVLVVLTEKSKWLYVNHVEGILFDVLYLAWE